LPISWAAPNELARGNTPSGSGSVFWSQGQQPTKLAQDLSDYSKSFDFGFRPGSFDKKPKIKRETKKITTV
jgi:hypothetical protein